MAQEQWENPVEPPKRPKKKTLLAIIAGGIIAAATVISEFAPAIEQMIKTLENLF